MFTPRPETTSRVLLCKSQGVSHRHRALASLHRHRASASARFFFLRVAYRPGFGLPRTSEHAHVDLEIEALHARLVPACYVMLFEACPTYTYLGP